MEPLESKRTIVVFVIDVYNLRNLWRPPCWRSRSLSSARNLSTKRTVISVWYSLYSLFMWSNEVYNLVRLQLLCIFRRFKLFIRKDRLSLVGALHERFENILLVRLRPNSHRKLADLDALIIENCNFAERCITLVIESHDLSVKTLEPGML